MGLVARSVAVLFTLAGVFVDAGNVSPLCTRYPRKRVVLFTLTSDNVDFLVNWFHYANDHLSSQDQVVVIPEDEDALAMVEYLSTSTKLKFDFIPLSSEARTALKEDPKSYLANKRPGHLLKLLEEGCTVLYTDVDTVWKDNVLADVDEAGNHELVVLPCAETEKAGVWAMSCELSTSFLYLQPTEKVKKLVRGWADAVSNERRIKPGLSKVLRENRDSEDTTQKIDLAAFPFEKFPPSKVARDNSGFRLLQTSHKKTHDEKVAFLKDYDLWQV